MAELLTVWLIPPEGALSLTVSILRRPAAHRLCSQLLGTLGVGALGLQRVNHQASSQQDGFRGSRGMPAPFPLILASMGNAPITQWSGRRLQGPWEISGRGWGFTCGSGIAVQP